MSTIDANGWKEGWTYLKSVPTALYKGTRASGLLVSVEGNAVLSLEPATLHAVLLEWEEAHLTINQPIGGIDEHDVWASVCDEIFRRILEKHTGHPISARAAVSVMASCVGEGLIATFSKEPTAQSIQNLRTLIGCRALYGARARFAIVTIDGFNVRGSGLTEAMLTKSKDLDGSEPLPEELPAVSNLRNFLDLKSRGYCRGGYGVFELIADAVLVADVIEIYATAVDRRERLLRIRSRQLTGLHD